MNEKALKVIEAAKSQLGNPYVFGMWGRECTPSVRRQYAGYNPSHKRAIFKACPVLSGKQSSCDGCKWQGKLAFDCRGFTYWCLSQVGITIKGGGATSQYNTAANWVQRGGFLAAFLGDGGKIQQLTDVHSLASFPNRHTEKICQP